MQEMDTSSPANINERLVRVSAGPVTLKANLSLPAGAQGVGAVRPWQRQ
jgi:hypothetical protein